MRKMSPYFSWGMNVNIFLFAEKKNCIYFLVHSLFSRASGRYFSLQIIPLPRADAIVSYGVRSAVIYVGSTDIGLIATRDKIRFITVKRDSKNLLFFSDRSFL